jgi:hypothetical protein
MPKMLGKLAEDVPIYRCSAAAWIKGDLYFFRRECGRDQGKNQNEAGKA